MVPQNAYYLNNQSVSLCGMDYKKEIGRRIRGARTDKKWTLQDLERRTGDVLSYQRIAAYETGERMPGPSETVILSKALGVRPAYLMALDDTQIPISSQEEALIRNWRTLPERERMSYFRTLQTLALQYRDPVSDEAVERHLGSLTKQTEKRK